MCELTCHGRDVWGVYIKHNAILVTKKDRGTHGIYYWNEFRGNK